MADHDYLDMQDPDDRARHPDFDPDALRPDQDCGQAGPHGCQFCAACLDWGDALAAAEGE